MDRSQIDEIKERLDIVEVAQSYLGDLKKSGASYFGLCPFHQEKTPSFSINHDLGIFKCFGCGEAGDVITFIEKMEGVEFGRALEIAAKRAGVILKKFTSPQEARLSQERQQILQANSLTTQYYHFILTEHSNGEKGRIFARYRHITKPLIEKFKIGYAPYGYTNLLTFLKSKGYKVPDLIRWGLVVSNKGRIYDKFRSRLIFPLVDHHDDIVGFSGRTTLKQTKAPKYLHSPHTILFDKGKFLFGLNQAKNDIRKRGFVIFCEGQLDVISSHKTNVTNIVASLGTSLTNEQLLLAKRYAKNIYFAFDNDLAGEKALIRSAELAHQEGLSVQVINIPAGKDADELINKNKKAWEDATVSSQPLIEHLIRRVCKRLDMRKLADKEVFVATLFPVITTLHSSIKQTDALHKMAVLLNLDADLLKEEFEALKQSTRSSKLKKGNIRKIIASPLDVREEYLLALTFQHPEFIKSALKCIKPRYLSLKSSKVIIRDLQTYLRKRSRFSIKSFIRKLKSGEKSILKHILLKKLDTHFEIETEFQRELTKLISFLRRNHYHRKLKYIKRLLEDAESREDQKHIRLLTQELKHITTKVAKEK